MLLRQHGGRNQYGDLFAINHGFERGPQRHLGFAIADIPADQPIHRKVALHIGFDFAHSPKLVFRFDIREAGFEFMLPVIIRSKRLPKSLRALRIEFEQFVRLFFDGLLRFGPGANPVRFAQPAERGGGIIRADIAGQPIRLMHGHEHHIRTGVFDHQILAFIAFDGAAAHPAETPDAVIDMDDVIAFL